jgi:bifunctional non-homologous end joining protein LigD
MLDSLVFLGSDSSMSLSKYRSKRHPERTPEPFGSEVRPASSARGGIFVVQKHDARRLHYDFRLEMEGVLRSWAVPKGPSMNPDDKHLAVFVEDHPLEYGDFEGVIPEGNYGAGSVIVWDRGVYTCIDPVGDPAEAVRKGKLDILMHGFKLRGAFTLVRTGLRNSSNSRDNANSKDKQNWLLIKKRDEYAATDDIFTTHPRSVLSGLTVEEMTDSSAVAHRVADDLARRGLPETKSPLRHRDFPLMLAKTVERPFDGDQWLFELKYDGVRALAIRDGGPAKIFARKGTDITARYPEVALALNALPYDRFVMDGEVVALDSSGRPSFQLLQRRMHVDDVLQVARLSFAVPVCDFVFDLLAFDRFDTRSLPLKDRKSILGELIRGDGPLRYCDYIVARGKDFYSAVVERNLEGIIAKLRDSPYRGGVRSEAWLKIKAPLFKRFVIGGYTDPGGTRTHFGALLLGQYESDGSLRFTDKVGTGFNHDRLKKIHRMMTERARTTSPFRKPQQGEPVVGKDAHFCEPELVCEVRFTEWTDSGGIRQPSFIGMVEGANLRDCVYEGPSTGDSSPNPVFDDNLGERGVAIQQAANRDGPERVAKVDTDVATITHPEKVFWPREGYTKGDLVAYYREISRWMLPYLKDRPVMLTRYPDGIDGKMFYQKDAPAFAPPWLRTEKIYSEDSQREIAYFIIDSEEALAYVANLAAITIHIWSSRITHLELPDWLLFDIDPKGSTTAIAVQVAIAVADVLRELGLEPCLKTSGQMGLHVMVGLKPQYTYEQARMFSELVSRVVISRFPKLATINRNPRSRQGKVYIDYLQLGHGKTIAGTFSVRPVPGAPVSSPMRWSELKTNLDPTIYNIKTMPQRMARLGKDPFIDLLEKPVNLDNALIRLEELLNNPDSHDPARS